MSKLSDTEYELLNSNLNAAITIKKLKEELETTKRQLEESLKVIEFYARENHWLGITDKVPFDVLKWIRIVENDMDENSLGGLHAREFLNKLKNEKGSK